MKMLNITYGEISFDVPVHVMHSILNGASLHNTDSLETYYKKDLQELVRYREDLLKLENALESIRWLESRARTIEKFQELIKQG